jgi:peptidoglycan/xylan/chitin deacetylase (PgdA/CDA1 family)
VTNGAGRRRTTTRRRILASAGSAAVLAWAARECLGPPQGQQEAAAAPSTQPSGPAPRKPAAPLRAAAANTLADYRRLVPGPAFPADAVALTIDDGPHPMWTPKVLALLDKHHVQATFFMIGNQVRGHEGVARAVVTAGHQIANHSWSHPVALWSLGADKIRAEIHRAQDKIYSTPGQVPALFRSPGGGWSPPLYAEAAAAGLLPINWSGDSKDWQRPGVAVIAQRLLASQPGQILLCHDGGGDRSQTYEALVTVIPALRSRGYTFVPLTAG